MSYRDDPAWRAARDRFIADTRDDESPDDAFARRVAAAGVMRQIEKGAAS